MPTEEIVFQSSDPETQVPARTASTQSENALVDWATSVSGRPKTPPDLDASNALERSSSTKARRGSVSRRKKQEEKQEHD